MIVSGFNKFYLGFIFIMIDFKVMGVDILPDIIGFIFFAIGFNMLSGKSDYFIKAENFNIPTIIISVFYIYQKPALDDVIQFSQFGLFGILVDIVYLALNLLVVYNLFMGIKDLAKIKVNIGIIEKTDKWWNHYLKFHVISILLLILIFIGPLAILYIVGMLIYSILLTICITTFMKECGRSL